MRVACQLVALARSMHFMKTWDEDIFMRLGAHSARRVACQLVALARSMHFRYFLYL